MGGQILICPPTQMIVAWHIVAGLKEVTLIMVEITCLLIIKSLLALRGLCLNKFHLSSLINEVYKSIIFLLKCG